VLTDGLRFQKHTNAKPQTVVCVNMTRHLFIVIFLVASAISKGQTPLWKLKFSTTDIYKWRIYYERGNTIDTLNVNKPIFAIEGDSAKLKATGVDTLLNEMFNVLRHSKIKKRTTIASGLFDKNPFNYKGNPEHISIWWQSKRDFNYYRILVTLKESPSIPEEKFNYVIVLAGPSGNNQTLHYVSKEKAIRVYSIMNYIANKNWGKDYVKNP